MNVLILGTGADINEIDFSKIDTESLIIGGVNRIYEKFIPDYYYVYDLIDLVDYVPDKIKTIYTHPAKLKEFFTQKIDYSFNYVTYYDVNYTPGYSYEGKHYDCGHGSINYLLRMFENYIFPGQVNNYFIAGVPLLEDVGHFYEDTKKTTSIQIVLDRFFNDFLRLKRLNYNIISLMEKSRLNEIFPTQKLDFIYRG